MLFWSVGLGCKPVELLGQGIVAVLCLDECSIVAQCPDEIWVYLEGVQVAPLCVINPAERLSDFGGANC